MSQRLSDYVFTSESVGAGHPDKVCDQISDAILDEFLKSDPNARVAVETMVTKDRVIISGEVRGPDISNGHIEEVTRRQIKKIGYDQPGFSWRDVNIDINMKQQSADIAQGVDSKGNKDEGAGDQGLMFGYACDETPALMPAAIHYSHKILQNIFADIEAKKIPIIGPDAKSQVTLEYKNDKPVKARSVVVSIQHPEAMTQDDVRKLVKPIVERTLPKGWMCPDDELYVNPTGRFVIGGPVGDVGLTGRKIIVDTYGGSAPHGGGAFSGKDPTKVDRSAAYMARYLAKNVVGAKLAKGCTIQLAYAIGVSKPLCLYVNLHGTGVVDENKLADTLWKLVDLTPRGIREHLKLNQPIYLPTATYGHFGREPGKDGAFTWEKLDLVEELKQVFKMAA